MTDIALDVTAAGVYTSGSSFTLPGITCGAGELVLLWTCQAIGNLAPSVPTSAHLTFNQLSGSLFWADAGFNATLCVFRSMPSVALSNEIITINMASGMTTGTAVLATYGNVAAGGTNGSAAVAITTSTAHSASTAVTVNMTTGTNNSLVVAGLTDYTATTYTAGSGQSMAVQTAQTLSMGIVDQNAVTPTSGTSVTSSATSPAGTGWAIIAVEIKPGSSGPITPAPPATSTQKLVMMI